MNNNAVKNGLILGGINILILFLIYIVDITMIADWKVGGLWFLFSLGLNFAFAFQLRKDAGGFMVFKQAFISIFVMLAVATVLSLVFKILLYNVIDTGIPEQIREASITQIESIFEAMGVDDDEAMSEALTKIEEQDFSMGISNITTELFVGLGMSAFFALIIALFVKKNPPLNYASNEESDDR